MARALIGPKLRDRRKALGITQSALAASVGISASYLNLIERDRRNIGGALLKRIADALAMPLEQLDGASERRLLAEVAAVAGEPMLQPLGVDPSSAGELAAGHPGWARALVALHRAFLDREQTVAALSDRLNHDPFLGDAVHAMLTRLTSIRSAAEILESERDLDPGRRDRFVDIVAGDSRRLSDVAQALAAYFDGAHTARRAVTPIEEVDDFLVARDNHFPRLEQAAERLHAAACADAALAEPALVAWLEREHRVHVACLPAAEIDANGLRNQVRFDRATRTLQVLDVASAASRRFQVARLAAELHCAAEIQAELDGATQLGTPAARRRAQAALSSYVAGAVLLPYEPFERAAAAVRCDVDALCRRFGVGFEQACHRLVTLRRPGAEGVRFGFMRADPAGYVTKRFPLPRLALPRHGHACPLWPIYSAFQAPGATLRQIGEFPGGERYLFVARAVEKERASFLMPRRLSAIMLVCDARDADRVVYGDGLDASAPAAVTPVGQTCRVCVRRDCSYRQEDPIIDAGLPA